MLNRPSGRYDQKNDYQKYLHVWEGMFHGFFYNPDVPESRDCFDVIVKFFDTHLGRTEPKS